VAHKNLRHYCNTFANNFITMNFKISNEIRVAILGIAALVAVVFGYNYLKGRGSFGSNRTFFAKYDNANGLTEGSFVQINGVTIGTVRKISLANGVLVEFNITDKNIKIPLDSKVAVFSDGLIAAKILGMVPGTSTTFAKENDTLQTFKEIGTLDKLSANAEPMMKNIDGTVTKAGTALASIDNTVNNINSIMDASTKANLQNSIAGLNKSVNDFNQISGTLAAQRQKIASTVASLDAFAANLNKNNAAINSTMTNVQTTTKKISELDLNSTVGELKNTLASLDGTISKINSNQGTMGMLVNDKKLYNDLQGSLHSLDALLADLKARPGRYISFSVFGKKQKYEEPVKAASQQ
jgi:phospholipid/cholesterol/gamma-HCH transport system substrate-binding protein